MQDENIQYPVVQELLAVANEYCWFVEKISNYEPEKALEFLRKIVPLLYVKGCMVTVPEDADEWGMQRYVTEETYEIIFNDIRNKLKQYDSFFVFNPDLKEPEEKSMAECVADIYQDLKDVMIAYMKGLEAEKESAVFCLQKWFAERWGAQAAILMPILHSIFINNNPDLQTGTEFD